MANDILQKVRDEILEEDKKYLPWVPKHLDKTWEHQAGVAGAVAGALAGFLAGSHMGLAGPWGAIAGTVPCTIIGGVIGYFGAAKIGSGYQRNKPVSQWNATSVYTALPSAPLSDANDHNRFPSIGSRKVVNELPAPSYEPAPLQSTANQVVPSYPHCIRCKARKSTWWDISKNCCRICGTSAFPSEHELTSEAKIKRNYCSCCGHYYSLKAGSLCPACKDPLLTSGSQAKEAKQVGESLRANQDLTSEQSCQKCGSLKSSWWNFERNVCTVCDGSYRQYAKERSRNR